LAKTSIPAGLQEKIAALLQEQGIELYYSEYKKEPHGQVLRIFIDTEEGVDIETCTRATRAIKTYIDDHSGLYYDNLEVSSPGIDRVLRNDHDLERFQGEQVLLRTTRTVEGRKKFIGILVASSPEQVNIEIDGRILAVDREIISVVRLHPKI